MIEVADISVKQGDFSMSNINFKIKTGEYVVLMGKTGCGKTTILETICGLRRIASGQIWLNNVAVSKQVPAKREIGYVPQDGALFSTMTVEKNIGFALKIRKWPKPSIKKRVVELADLMGIAHLLDRSVQGLSGGEKQRIALARALSFYPKVLCLDEPLSALDESTKNNMIALLKTLKESLNLTVLHITHSNSEATQLADRVLLFENGKINEFENA